MPPPQRRFVVEHVTHERRVKAKRKRKNFSYSLWLMLHCSVLTSGRPDLSFLCMSCLPLNSDLRLFIAGSSKHKISLLERVRVSEYSSNGSDEVMS